MELLSIVIRENSILRVGDRIEIDMVEISVGAEGIRIVNSRTGICVSTKTIIVTAIIDVTIIACIHVSCSLSRKLHTL